MTVVRGLRIAEVHVQDGLTFNLILKWAYCKMWNFGIPHRIPDVLFLDNTDFIAAAIIMHLNSHLSMLE